MALIDNYLKKKDPNILEQPRTLLIDRYSTRKNQVVPPPKEKKSLLDRVKNFGLGTAKFATRTGVEVSNLVTGTLDFAADFLAGHIEKQIKNPTVSPGIRVLGISSKNPQGEILAQKWKEFYNTNLGSVTEKAKTFTQDLRDVEFIQPTEEWKNASNKEKFTTRLPETILNIGPGVVSSLGLYAFSGGVGYVASIGSTADEVKSIAIAEGVDEDRAEKLGLSTGILVGWLDKIVPDEVFSPAQKKQFIGGFAKRILRTGLKEVGTEIAQEDIQLLAESTVRDDITKDEIITRNLMAGLGGLLGGVGAQSAASFVNGVRNGDIAGLNDKSVNRTVVDKTNQVELNRELGVSQEEIRSSDVGNRELTTKKLGVDKKQKLNTKKEDSITNPVFSIESLIKEENKATSLMEQGVSKSEVARQTSFGAVQGASQRKRGLGLLADLDYATKAGDQEIVEKVAQEILSKPKDSVYGQYQDSVRNIIAKPVSTEENVKVIPPETKVAQEKVVKVPKGQLPVGTGKEKVSRLQARLKGALDNISKEDIEKLGLSTFRQAKNDEQMAKVREYAQKNTEDAIKAANGEIDPPDGMLQNSIWIALTEMGAFDTDLAMKLATMRSTRFGQEIQILKLLQENNPVVMMQEIVQIRIEAYENRTGNNANKRIKTEVDRIKGKSKPTTKQQWDEFINTIRC